MSFGMDELTQVDLGKLSESVDDWNAISKNLKQLAADADTKMRARSDKADWEGVNAGVSKSFIQKTAKEFSDAEKEARSLYKVLDDAYEELKSIQKNLKQILNDEAPDHNVNVSDVGKGKVQVTYQHDRSNPGDERTQEELDYANSLGRRIETLIAHAREVDESAGRALAKIHGSDANNFGHANYKSLDDAQARRAEELAEKSMRLQSDGKELSSRELKELQTVLRYNANDKDFSTSFYKGLGQEGALRFQAQLSIDAKADGGEQQKLSASIQDSMGKSLAKAIPQLGDKWTDELMRVGREDLDVKSDPPIKPPFKGYQVLGVMMSHGKYPEAFLDDVANDMIKYEREGGRWPHPMGDTWVSEDAIGINAHAKAGSGWDPLTGILDAYGHNPDAATSFFDSPVAGEGERMSNLQYLIGTGENGEGSGARNWIPDTPNGSPLEGTVNYGKQALGHALEAAVTGMPFDHGAVESRPAHTPERFAIMNQIVDIGAKSPDVMDDEMMGSVGRMAGEYMPEINSTLRQDDAFSDLYGSQPFSDELGQRSPDSTMATVEFLDLLGRNPDSYAEVTLGAQNYSANLMNDVVAHPGNYHDDPKANIHDIAYGTNTIEGIISGARHDEILTVGQKSEDDYNEAIQKRADTYTTIFETTVGAATERVPVAGELINWGNEQAVAAVMDSAEKNSTNELSHEAGKATFDSRGAAHSVASQAVLDAALNDDARPEYEKAASKGVDEGFDHGRQLQEDAKDHFDRRQPE